MDPKRIAVVKNRALGDTIITLGALKYLREILPQTDVYYFVPDWTESLFKFVDYPANSVTGFKLRSPFDWIKTYRELKKLDVDAILEFSQGGRTGLFFKIYSTLCRVPYFYHNHHTTQGPVRDQGVQKAIIQRDLDAVWTFFGRHKQLPIPNYLDYPPELTRMGPAKLKRVIFGVVATRETKMYPLDKYTRLARLIKASDPEMEIVAPLSGSDMDKKIAHQLQELNAPIEPVYLNLSELPAYFADSMIYIGNDTGLKHLAIAMDIPTVTLFGPEPPLEWHPYNKVKHPYFFRNPLPCRYETGKTYCPLSQCSSMICLSEIKPEAIWEKAKVVLQSHNDKGIYKTPESPSDAVDLPDSESQSEVSTKSLNVPDHPVPLEKTNIPSMDKEDIDFSSFDLGPTTQVTQTKKTSKTDN